MENTSKEIIIKLLNNSIGTKKGQILRFEESIKDRQLDSSIPALRGEPTDKLESLIKKLTNDIEELKEIIKEVEGL